MAPATGRKRSGMATETAAALSADGTDRSDAAGVPEAGSTSPGGWRARWRRASAGRAARLNFTAALALGLCFVAFGGADRELGVGEARHGLSATADWGPFGRLHGNWDPVQSFGWVASARAWHGLFGDVSADQGVVRWPSILAGLAAGLALSATAHRIFGRGAGIWAALTWFGSLALIDHTDGLLTSLFSGLPIRGYLSGADLLTGLFAILALNRVSTRGSDWISGTWTAFAVLSGGWPALLAIGLPLLVIGRRGAYLGAPLVLPAFAAFGAWSAWGIRGGGPLIWSVAVTLPLKQGAGWWLTPTALALSAPWTPMLAAGIWAWRAAAREEREGDDDGSGAAVGAGGATPGRYAGDWAKIGATSLFAGTLIPGLAGSALPLALASGALLSALGCAWVWSGASERGSRGSVRPRRLVAGLSMLTVLGWTALFTPAHLQLVFQTPYYRPIGIALLVLTGLAVWLGVVGGINGSGRMGLAALALVAVGFKWHHWGIYAPEWNYRVSQAPWGRAIGQWVPPGRPLFILGTRLETWPADLMFGVGHPIRLVPNPQALRFFNDGPRPTHVLLHPAELRAWPEDAPEVEEIFTFYSQTGFDPARVLVRIPGEPGWRRKVGHLPGEPDLNADRN